MEKALHTDHLSQLKSRPIYSLFQSAIAQIIGFGVGYFLFEEVGVGTPVMVGSHTVIAVLLSRALKLSLPWQFFNLLVPIGVYGIIIVELPNILLLLLAGVLLLIYFPTYWTKVPYYPTSEKMYWEILSLLPEKKEFLFVDLGCGFGDLLLFLSKERRLGKFYGVEIGPLPFILAKIRASIRAKQRIKISFQSIWKLSLSDYDFVYAFLSPEPMEKLWGKVKTEMKPGSIFLTNSFEVSSPASKIIQVEDKRRTKLFVHEIK